MMAWSIARRIAPWPSVRSSHAFQTSWKAWAQQAESCHVIQIDLNLDMEASSSLSEKIAALSAYLSMSDHPSSHLLPNRPPFPTDRAPQPAKPRLRQLGRFRPDMIRRSILTGAGYHATVHSTMTCSLVGWRRIHSRSSFPKKTKKMASLEEAFTYGTTIASGATNAGMPDAPIKSMKVAVLAAGSFGTAMASIAARRNHQVTIYARDAKSVEAINTTHRNPKIFSEFELPPTIRATTSVEEACSDAEMVIVCLPAQMTPGFLAAHKDCIHKDALLVITGKGLYLKTKQLLSIPILEGLGRDQPLTFLSGPSFALELMKRQPSAVVVASKFLYHAVAVQRALSTIDFRIYSSQDIIGVQLGGALKNPLAIGAGMIEGAGLGINSLAAYVTRSSFELQRLCVAMGGQPLTIAGLSGIGDLMLTAFGELSRNRKCGMRVIRGEKLEDIMKETTVEGVATAEVAVYFAEQCGLDLPFFKAVNAMLKGELKKEELQQVLMNRPLKSET